MVIFTDLEAAERARLELIERLQDIDAQLTLRRSQVSGHVPDSVFKDYVAWKSRAVVAKNRISTKLRNTKKWIKEQRVKEGI